MGRCVHSYPSRRACSLPGRALHMTQVEVVAGNVK